jgi:hypothetical protein
MCQGGTYSCSDCVAIQGSDSWDWEDEKASKERLVGLDEFWDLGWVGAHVFEIETVTPEFSIL